MNNTINPLKSIPFWVIIISVLIADVFSKYAVFEWLENKPNQHVELIGKYIAFSKHINEGAVWGIASGKYIFLVVVKIDAAYFVCGLPFGVNIMPLSSISAIIFCTASAVRFVFARGMLSLTGSLSIERNFNTALFVVI